MNSINLIIFDCDGVLLDSQEPINKFEWEYLSDLGLSISLKEFNQIFSGERVLSILERIEKEGYCSLNQSLPLLAQKIEEALLSYLSHYKIKPMAGITKLLKSLLLKKCVASNCFSKLLRALLTSSGLWPYFEPDVFSYEEVGSPKPAPDLFLYAAHKMGEAAQNCLVIEDSVVGVKAAKAAGMNVCGFIGGSHATFLLETQLIAVGALYAFRDMKEVSFFLRDILPSTKFQYS